MPGFEQVLLGLALQHSKTAVLVVSDQMSGEMVRALMKLEAWDVLPLDVTETDVVKRLRNCVPRSGYMMVSTEKAQMCLNAGVPWGGWWCRRYHAVNRERF